MPPSVKASEESEVSREDLYEQVWTTPASHLAKKFGVSGSYLARVCDALNVPRPPVGYWQKKAAGKDKPRPDLPPASPGDQLRWTKEKPIARPIRKPVQKKTQSTPVAQTGKTGRHPILTGVEGHFRKTRKLDEGEFLRPYKKLLPDIIASEGSLHQAIEIANEIYKSLSVKGHRVQFAPPDQKTHRVAFEERETPGKDRKYGRYSMGTIWSPHRPTITFVGDVPFGITLTEMTERATMRYIGGKFVRENTKLPASRRGHAAHTWTTEQDLPCGRFRLIAYSPFQGVAWTKSWQDTPQSSIKSMVPAIIRKLEKSKGAVRKLMAEAESAAAQRKIDWEESQKRWHRADDQRRVAQARTDSQKQLSEIMDRWASTMSVERFFLEAETRVEGLDGERKDKLLERLRLARSMLGTLDPLEHLEGWIPPDEIYRTKFDQD